MKKLIVYCAIPHRRGIDSIENGEWGLDFCEHQYVHERYGDTVSKKDFTQDIKPLLPDNYTSMFKYPTGQGSGAISLELCQDDFTEENWEKVLTLLRIYFPKTAQALSI